MAKLDKLCLIPGIAAASVDNVVKILHTYDSSLGAFNPQVALPKIHPLRKKYDKLKESVCGLSGLVTCCVMCCHVLFRVMSCAVCGVCFCGFFFVVLFWFRFWFWLSRSCIFLWCVLCVFISEFVVCVDLSMHGLID